MLGRRDEAVALAREELELARAWGAPTGLGRSLRVLGELLGKDGIAELEQAVELLEASDQRLERARALAALGAEIRRARRPSDAREPLRRALEIAEVAGAKALEEHVRSELYATGARPRTTALDGVESLTERELRVATLAADGQTNRDIAQTLYVTPKTVEVHLSNAYRKLGIGSRRELPTALAAYGSIPQISGVLSGSPSMRKGRPEPMLGPCSFLMQLPFLNSSRGSTARSSPRTTRPGTRRARPST